MTWFTSLLVCIALVAASGCTHTNNSPLHASLYDRDFDRVAPQVFPKGMPTVTALHMAHGLMCLSEYGHTMFFIDYKYGGTLPPSTSRGNEFAERITRIELELHPAPTFTTFLGRAPDQLLAVDCENGLLFRLQHRANPRADEVGSWRTIPWEQGSP